MRDLLSQNSDSGQAVGVVEDPTVDTETYGLPAELIPYETYLGGYKAAREIATGVFRDYLRSELTRRPLANPFTSGTTPCADNPEIHLETRFPHVGDVVWPAEELERLGIDPDEILDEDVAILVEEGVDCSRLYPMGEDDPLFLRHYWEAQTSTTKAKKNCASCPVRQECLTFSVASEEFEGVWGGWGPSARVSISIQFRKLQKAYRTGRMPAAERAAHEQAALGV